MSQRLKLPLILVAAASVLLYIGPERSSTTTLSGWCFWPIWKRGQVRDEEDNLSV